MEHQVVADLVRLINERPVKRWYLKKSSYPDDIDWGKVITMAKDQGLQCEDQVTMVKGWIPVVRQGINEMDGINDSF